MMTRCQDCNYSVNHSGVRQTEACLHYMILRDDTPADRGSKLFFWRHTIKDILSGRIDCDKYLPKRANEMES